MREYATSREVHSTLSKFLSPWFRSQGWKRRKGQTCAFTGLDKSHPNYWCFWVQCSQWGNRDFGNEFTVNLGPQQSPEQRLAWSGHNDRILRTLIGTDLEEGLATETRIVARIPKPPENRPIYEWMKLPDKMGADFRKSWDRAFMPHPELWRTNCDIWLRYFAVDDVEEWGKYLLPRLSYLTAMCGNDIAK